MAFQRDPVSELFDGGARKLLARAYAAPGSWQSTRLAPPGPRHIAHLAGLGINPLAPDNPSAEGGPDPGTSARSRWARGFVRAVYYQHRWYSGTGGAGWRAARRTVPRHAGALEVTVGRRTGLGQEVRARLRPGGARALAAVQRLGEAKRIYDSAGSPAGRWSDPARRDW